MAIHYYHLGESLAGHCRGGVVTVGNFDGVHVGHQALLRETHRLASEINGPAVAVTFYPHPLQLLRPHVFQPMLTSVVHRADLLEAFGIDQVIVLMTTHPLLQLSAHDFFQQILLRQLNAQAIVEGANFGFGRNREGNVQTLQAFCKETNRRFILVPPVSVGDQPVSSSRVRAALLRGDVRTAAQLLGRPFRILGTVGRGQRRGLELGFPTANLEGLITLIPADGVYAVRVHAFGTVWAGAANIGPNPTFNEQTRKVEIHLIDFHEDLYGQALMVDFLERLRDTRSFGSPAELMAQLRQDVDQARLLADPSAHPPG